jgi:hypothetical protein
MPSTSDLAIAKPVPVQQVSASQLRTFEMMKRRAGLKLSGIFNSDVWDKMILQASVDEPAIFHAVAAVGAAYRSAYVARASNCYRMLDGLSTDENGAVALLEYNQAIRCLEQFLVRQDRQALRICLMSCILFILFEYLRRDLRTADTHLVNGLRLMRGLQTEIAEHPELLILGNPPSSTDELLVETFARLDLQTAPFGFESKWTSQYVYVPSTTPFDHCLMPLIFESVQEARRFMDGILSSTYRYLSQHCRLITGAENTSHVHFDQNKILHALAIWRASYSKTILRSNVKLIDVLAYKVLRMYCSMAEIMCSVAGPSHSQLNFDVYDNAFQSIIWQAEDILVGASEYHKVAPHEEYSGNKVFTAEMGFLPPLYYTGLKCRHPYLRREATRLLRKHPYLEGIWDSELAAEIVERVTALEEGSMYKSLHISEICSATSAARQIPILPESSRFLQVRVMLPKSGVTALELECVRQVWDDIQGWQFPMERHALVANDADAA